MNTVKLRYDVAFRRNALASRKVGKENRDEGREIGNKAERKKEREEGIRKEVNRGRKEGRKEVNRGRKEGRKEGKK
jgi:hypothetical protein